MNKLSILGAVAAALIGGGLIWTAGNGGSSGIAGWETLNAQVEKATTGGRAATAGGGAVSDGGSPASRETAGVKETAQAGGSPVPDSGNAAAPETAKAEETAEAAGNLLSGSGDTGAAARQEAPKTAAAPAGDDARSAAPNAAQTGESGSPVTNDSAGYEVVASGSTAADASAEGKVNVNTAGISELTSLPGIGEKKAQAILDYRNQHEPFRNASDLGKVKGIGPKMLEKLRSYILF
ncbi:competence protein ComEA [Paenibacillus forsythiae]|uniref:Competence protein ComEA n=1 Tax=Paenibacillus forsythiae TaxID=365616 RepID=A0ABU3H9C3_9BACL|nr:ComEA family DNA-binding protein [Paenibacillus forsythiae]MDT3426617.1 competence protein ComEA [Paenibacillus forsythiae]